MYNKCVAPSTAPGIVLTHSWKTSACTYVVNAADQKAITRNNEMDKFADDSYINVPAVNSSSRLAEIKHAENWASVYNLKVNPTNYMEIVFVDKRRKGNAQPPPPLPGIE